MKKLFIIFLLLILSTTIYCQYSKKHALYSANGNWIIEVNGGINFFLSEGFLTYNITESAGYLTNATMRYNINELFGLKLKFGYMNNNWPDMRLPLQTIHNFDAENLSFEAYINLNELLLRNYRNRVLNFYIYGGGGLSYRNKSEFSSSIISPLVCGGLQAEYPLSPIWSIHLITDVNILNDNYNEFRTGTPFEIIPSISLGISYNLSRNKNACKCL